MEAVHTYRPNESKSKHAADTQKKGSRAFVQAKLNQGKAGDKYEKEADAVADKITSPSDKHIQQKPLADTISPFVQKKEEEPTQKKEDESVVQAKIEDEPNVQKKEDEIQKKTEAAPEEKKIQKKDEEGVQAKMDEKEKPSIQKQEDEAVQSRKKNVFTEKEDTQFVENKLKDTKGQGSPMSTAIRQEMESHFGVKLQEVRIHTSESATQMSRSLGAQAFTNGKDIYFNEGKYNPATIDGKHLLAHELTHTVQQGAIAEQTNEKFEEIKPIQLNPSLDQAMAFAESERGRVNAKAKNPDGTRVGHERLLQYFKTAFGANWDGSLEANIRTYSTTATQSDGLVKDNMPSWCGIFIWWAYKRAGIPISDWQLGVPMGSNIGNYPAPHVPLPGDIGQKKSHQHFAMVMESDGKMVKTINGNTAGSDNLGGQIEIKNEPASAFEVFYNPLGGKLNGTLPNLSEEELAQDKVKVETKTSNEEFSNPKEKKQALKKGKNKEGEAKEKELSKGKKGIKEESVEKGQKSKRAPRSPEEDPAFQAVKKRSKTTAEKVKTHEPAAKKQADVAAAAVGPANELESKAQDAQNEEFAAQETPGFDATSFKKALKAKLEEITPKNLEEADEFKDKNKAEKVKEVATEGVKAEKEKTAGPVEEKNKEPLNTSGFEVKEVTPLPVDPAEPKPKISNPKDAAPKKRAEEEYTLQKESQDISAPLEQNNITDSQLQNANEPEFSSAVETKNSTQSQVTQSETQFKKEETKAVKKGENLATSSTESALEIMQGQKQKSNSTVASDQQQSKTKDELERKKVADDINTFYTSTKTKVEGILTKLETDVNTVFDQGAALAKLTFEKDVEKKMSDYKDRRYSGATGKARWVKDLFADLPSEVNKFYEESRDQYLKDMDIVIDTVANIVATKLNEAKQAVNDGKTEIKKYVEGLPKNLQQYGKESADAIQGKFDELEQQINDKQDQLIDNLAQKYKENLEAVDARITELKEANKGLISKAVDAVAGVIKTILELKDMLLNVLAKAAAAIEKIISDPIQFLKNLVAGIKAGLSNFVGNIWKHLQAGFISWLTGEFSGVGLQMPDTWDMKGIFSFVMQLLGLTWDNIRMRAVKKLGEPVVKALETAFEIFQIIRKEGLAGLWNYIKEKIGDLKVAVWDAIQSFIVEKVITAGITWVIGLLNPAGAFIKACKLIYDIVIFFIENAKRLIELVNAIVDSVLDIANGAIAGAAKKVEDALAKIIPIAIGFLASLVGVGGVSKKVKSIIDAIRKPINKAIDWVLDQAVKVAKKLGLDKLVKKAKGLVAKLFAWWKMKSGFQTPDKKSHTVFFKGDQKNGKLTIASVPTPIEVYLKSIDITTDPNLKAPRDSALAKAKEIEQETKKESKAKTDEGKEKFEKEKEKNLKEMFTSLQNYLSKLPSETKDKTLIPKELLPFTLKPAYDEEKKSYKPDFKSAVDSSDYVTIQDKITIRRRSGKADLVPALYINPDNNYKIEMGAERDSEPDHKNYKPENIKISQTKGIYTADFTTKTYDGKSGPSYSVDISFKKLLEDSSNKEETRVVKGSDLVFKPEGNPRGVTDSAKHGFDNAHLIGDRFGGTGYNQSLNIYPSSPNYNRIAMLGKENKIAELVKDTSGYNMIVTAVIHTENTSHLEAILHKEFSHDNKKAGDEIKKKADEEITKTLRAEIAKDMEGLPGQYISVDYHVDKPKYSDGLKKDEGYGVVIDQYELENVNSGTTTKKAS